MAKDSPLKRTAPPIQKAMGERIAGARKRAGLTQTQVAMRLSAAVGRHIPRNTYGHYETGFASVESLTLRELAKIIQTTPDYLLGNPPATIPAGVQAIFRELPQEDHAEYENTLRQKFNREKQLRERPTDDEG